MVLCSLDGELNIFFHISVMSSIVVGVVILVVLDASKVINDYLERVVFGCWCGFVFDSLVCCFVVIEEEDV